MALGHRQRGFTLMEIMVVVALVALMSAVVISQGSWVSDDNQLDQEVARLQDTLELMNESSLFSGQLMALRLRHNGWTPLAYDREEQQFMPVNRPGVERRDLPASLELVWQLDNSDNLDQRGEKQLSLKDVAEKLVEDDPMGEAGGALLDKTSQKESDSESDQEDDKPFPQVFFFPSGETSPVTLTLRSREDLEMEIRRRLTSLGQVSDPDDDNPDHREGP